MLGREYTILGTVEEGKHLGRSLGFPTANLSAHSEQFPPEWRLRGGRDSEGEKSSRSGQPRGSSDRRLTARRNACSNFISSISIAIIYGEEVELRFLRYLRPEQKFENLAALREQIVRDVAAARRGFCETPA